MRDTSDAELSAATYSMPAEAGLLGCILQDGGVLDSVQPQISVDDFYDRRNGMVYKAMLELHSDRKPIDPISLREQMGDDLSRIGGVARLSVYMDETPSALNWSYYSKVVSNKAYLRSVRNATVELQGIIAQGGDDAALLERVERELLALSSRGSKGKGDVTIKDAVIEAIDLIERCHVKKGCGGIPTGFPVLDRLTAGLHAGNMIVLAARPSMGKTTLAMNIARHVAMEEGLPVGIFSIEMTSAELGIRMLSHDSRTDSRLMMAGECSEQDIKRITVASGKIIKANMHIDDGPLTDASLRSKARRMHAQHGIRLIVIDYLQLMTSAGSGRSDSRVNEVSRISNAIKSIAKELRVPVIVLSQLNRKVEERGNADGPRLSDLRDSGAIEQDCDLCLMLHRPNPESDIHELKLMKNRNGPVGYVELEFNRKHYKFHTPIYGGIKEEKNGVEQ